MGVLVNHESAHVVMCYKGAVQVVPIADMCFKTATASGTLLSSAPEPCHLSNCLLDCLLNTAF